MVPSEAGRHLLGMVNVRNPRAAGMRMVLIGSGRVGMFRRRGLAGGSWSLGAALGCYDPSFHAVSLLYFKSVVQDVSSLLLPCLSRAAILLHHE